MDDWNIKIKKLMLDHYIDDDGERQLKEIEEFEKTSSDDPLFEKQRSSLILLKADSFENASRYDEALANFTILVDYTDHNLKSFYLQRIATILIKLDRLYEAAKVIEDRILEETSPNYILDLLYWYVMNIDGAEMNLHRYKSQILKIANELDVHFSKNIIEPKDQIVFFKNERVAAGRRYNDLCVELRNLSQSDKFILINNYISTEHVGYFRKLATEILKSSKLVI